jgi:hypothetical protein
MAEWTPPTDAVVSEENKEWTPPTDATEIGSAKKKCTHFYIECGKWYIHIGIRTED